MQAMHTQTVTQHPADLTLREARERYLAANGFSMDEYSKPTFGLPILGKMVQFPNPPARQRVIARHDLHHLLTGYGTDYAGEGEIGAWELRAGCNTFFLYFINIVAMMGGMLRSPLRVWRAFRAARGQRSLYLDGRELEALLDLPIGEVRRQLGIPTGGHTAARA
jgi:ubiquinone biosynthesis protein Coq4